MREIRLALMTSIMGVVFSIVMGVATVHAVTQGTSTSLVAHSPHRQDGACPTVQRTPQFTIAYGNATIDGNPAPVGTVVSAYDPRGNLVGCTQVRTEGVYPSMYIYGEDNSVDPPIPGMRTSEEVSFQVNDLNTTSAPALPWVNDRDVHQVTLTATTYSPPVAPELSINATLGHIWLTWTDNTANVSYEVHRSSIPFFTPDATTLLASLPAGNVSYVDIGAAGDPVNNHFYLVRAAGAGGEFASSNRVGEIDYALNNQGDKYTLIATPFLSNSVTDAATLAQHIGSISSLLAWNPSSQAFRFFASPNIGDNFVIQPGSVVFVSVQVGGPDIVTLTGDVVTIQYDLQPDGFNFISLPLQRDDLTDAASVAVDMSGVISMLSWNAPVQAFRFFAPPDIGDNFAIGPGSPFIVNLGPDAAPVWPDNALDAVDSTTMPSVHRLQ